MPLPSGSHLQFPPGDGRGALPSLVDFLSNPAGVFDRVHRGKRPAIIRGFVTQWEASVAWNQGVHWNEGAGEGEGEVGGEGAGEGRLGRTGEGKASAAAAVASAAHAGRGGGGERIG